MIIQKKILLIFIFFLFNFQNVFSKDNIAFLDVELIINKSKPALIIIKKIENLRDQETKKLRNIEAQLKKKNDDIIKTKNLISEEEFKKKVSSLRKELKSFDELKKKTTKELNIKRNKELNSFLKLINPIIQEYMKNNSINIIIDKKNIFMAKSENDITSDILEIINKKIK